MAISSRAAAGQAGGLVPLVNATIGVGLALIATTFADPGTVPPARRHAIPVGADRYRPNVLLIRGTAKVAIAR